MAETRKAVVDADGYVLNVIVVEGDFDPGDGLTLANVPDDVRVDLGRTRYAGRKFVNPPADPPDPTEVLADKYRAGEATQAEKDRLLDALIGRGTA